MSLNLGLSSDLTSCDREKIQFISSIQAHGCFVSVGAADFRIRNVSENFKAYFNRDRLDDLKGRRLSDVIGNELATVLQNKIKSPTMVTENRHAFRWQVDRDLNVYLFRMANGSFGFEFEDLARVSLPNAIVENAEESLLRSLREMKDAREISALGGVACRAIRQLTGMSRVMMYRFSPVTWEGVVVSEDRVANAHSFLNHRFPSTDIPKPARDLYLRNQVRFIYDSYAEILEIHPRLAAEGTEPIDLSDSRLRAVSPIHIVYLKNMKVRTSFSVAITVGGVLWGLIACHNEIPLYISHSVRSLCETVANAIGLSAPLLEIAESRKSEIEFQTGLLSLFNDLGKSEQPLNRLFQKSDRVLTLFRAHGVAFVSGQAVDYAGTVPSKNDLVEIAGIVREHLEANRTSIFETRKLSDFRPEFEAFAENISGLLAVNVPAVGEGVFMVFRPEQIQTIDWGGDPRKLLAGKEFQGTINPRESFSSWSETIRGFSEEWREFEVAGLATFRNLIFDTLIKNERMMADFRSSSKPWKNS